MAIPRKDEPRPSRPKRGDIVEVTAHGLAFGGAAVARHDGFVLFSKYLAPGDVAKVRITHSKKNYGEGELVSIVEPSPDRIQPVCPLFGTCGGCSWQHLPVAVQNEWKRQIVIDSLRGVQPGFPIDVNPLVPSPNSFRYRNKSEFTFARQQDGTLVAGFHKPNNWREILDVQQCWLMPEPMDRVLRAAVAEGERQHLSAWNPRLHQGTLRQLVFRYSEAQKGMLALLLTGDRELDFDAMVSALFAADPALRGVTWGLNAGQSDVARASEILGTQGDEQIEEQLGDLRFQISLASFFQTNTKGAEQLYSVVKRELDAQENDVLLDAYCGTGTIGLFCADSVSQVYGIEIIKEAIWDARANAARNGIDNATFVAGDMREALPLLMRAIEHRITHLVVDPPRSGMEKKALEQLAGLGAWRVVYVSCNPTTMARDLAVFCEHGYKVKQVTPVDMFPQTYHIECVATLDLEILF